MKTQLVCPRCHHEFAYDNGYYDREITRLGLEIQDIMLQLAKHNELPWPEKKARQAWWERTKKALAIKQKQMGELKAFRKIADQQRKSQEFIAFQNAVKEKYGNEVFAELLGDARERIASYDINSLAKHGYTRKGGGITSVSKL